MPVELTYFQAVVLGVVEGLTEFLPISSTGHLTIAEHLLGLPVDAPAVTAYTAIIQIGAIVATFIYFARKIADLFLAWVRGLRSAPAREHRDYRLAWAVVIGSLIPGVSRSGATISAGLALGINRVTATELSFFMAIPALTAAGLFQLVEAWPDLEILGLGQMLVGIVVAFITAYASIAWLLRFVATNSLRPFVWYRVGLGLLLAVALATGWMSAT